MQPGYYRDYDSWLYLSSTGDLYYVDGPDLTEPAWQNIGTPLGDDAKPKTPHADELALFERTRVAYGIAA
jgi:hypothetical protein